MSTLTMKLWLQRLKSLIVFITCMLVNTLHAYANDTDLDKATLTIYTYDSFVSEWGMAPKIKPAFEAQCECTVNFVALADAVAMLQRLKLEGKRSQADIVLGLDLNLIDEAKKTGLFAKSSINLDQLNLPIAWNDDTFIPFDYGYFAFVYDTQTLPNPPTSLDELVNSDDSLQVVIQDPRSSTPGLGLLLWMKSVYGDEAPEAWAKFSDNILTTTQGWSEAYFNLFLTGEAPMVLSYSTSPAYHMAVENTDRYQAANFAEGHYLQVEVAGKLKNAKHPKLADDFLRFMVSQKFQEHVSLTNVMYPVNNNTPLPEAYNQLITPTKVLKLDDKEVNQKRKAWVEEWLEVMSR